MQSLLRAVVFATLAMASAFAERSVPAQQQPVVLKARGMIDVDAGRLVENATVVIQGDRIVAAGRTPDVQVPANASIVDLPSMILLPGLIDAHVHLTLGGNPAANARATLDAGFTTVQDLGAAAYGNVRLRDAIKEGRVPGPRVVASGPWLGISGGICDFNGIGVRGEEAFRQRVRDDVEHGADLIKVCVTGWLAAAVESPSKYEISDAELSAAIGEAQKHGKRVAVHAMSEAGIGAAVRLGADLVVHAGFPSRPTVDAMKARGVWQLPTLYSFSTAKPQHLAAVVTHMRQAVAAGLPVAVGTDAGRHSARRERARARALRVHRSRRPGRASRRNGVGGERRGDVRPDRRTVVRTPGGRHRRRRQSSRRPPASAERPLRDEGRSNHQVSIASAAVAR